MKYGQEAAFAPTRRLIEVLERKKKELGLKNDAELCHRIGIARSAYSRVKNGYDLFPRAKVTAVADFLGLDSKRLEEELYPDPPLLDEQTFDKADLQFFLQVVDAAGVPLRLSTLMAALSDWRKGQTKSS